jgi:predicted aspartyl protease
MGSQAFTIKANGLISRIRTPVSIRQSFDYCQTFNLRSDQVDVAALWDTGASLSSISQGLAAKLGLSKVDRETVAGFGGYQVANIDIVDILLPNQVVIPNVRVAEFFDNGKFDVIVGMDIITLGDFSITNHGGLSVVSFRMPPGNKHTDYVAEE